jgi:DNA helicase-2/ATP-dependent DNA helicase PcrA
MMSNNNWLDELNPAQRKAVEYIDGPSLVIAGAGSGKTRVLTYKIAYLLEHGMKPWNILALTFTNKAADEMKSRIERQVGQEMSHGLWMGTFHSIFARILRTEHETIGFSSDFTIYDAADSKSLVRSIIREMGLDDKTYKAGTVLSHISSAKNRLILPAQYQRDEQLMRADQSARIPETGKIYANYWARCRQAGAMDFDDLLLYTYLLFIQPDGHRARHRAHGPRVDAPHHSLQLPHLSATAEGYEGDSRRGHGDVQTWRGVCHRRCDG